MKTGEPNAHSRLDNAAGPKKQRAKPQEESSGWRQVRCALPRATDDQQLLLEQEILSDDVLDTAPAKQLGTGRQYMDQKQRDLLHIFGRLPELPSTTRLR